MPEATQAASAGLEELQRVPHIVAGATDLEAVCLTGAVALDTHEVGAAIGPPGALTAAALGDTFGPVGLLEPDGAILEGVRARGLVRLEGRELRRAGELCDRHLDARDAGGLVDR